MTAMPKSLALWQDRRGQLSWLRVATLAILVWPLVLATIDASRGGLGGRPLNDLIHRTGWWALVFLLASLAVTPLRQAGRYAKLVDIRRMVGVAAMAYALLHLTLYVTDEKFDLVKVATEILVRPYLTIGFVALLGLLALGVTSNDAMVKRMGGLNWRRLHLASYVIALLALIHFFQQTKADVTVPTLYAGLFLWLMGYRLIARFRPDGTLDAPWLAGLAIVAGGLTLLGEAVGIALTFGVSPLDILATAFDLDLGLRPGWSVMGAGLAVAALDLVRGWMWRRRPANPARRAPTPRAAS